MLAENMYIGMKVARRVCGFKGVDYKYTEEDLNKDFDDKPYYIVRWIERPHDELNRVTNPKQHCVINGMDLTKNNDDYREGSYSQACVLEPYDLAMKKRRNNIQKGGK